MDDLLRDNVRASGVKLERIEEILDNRPEVPKR